MAHLLRQRVPLGSHLLQPLPQPIALLPLRQQLPPQRLFLALLTLTVRVRSHVFRCQRLQIVLERSDHARRAVVLVADLLHPLNRFVEERFQQVLERRRKGENWGGKAGNQFYRKRVT